MTILLQIFFMGTYKNGSNILSFLIMIIYIIFYTVIYAMIKTNIVFYGRNTALQKIGLNKLKNTVITVTIINSVSVGTLLLSIVSQ